MDGQSIMVSDHKHINPLTTNVPHHIETSEFAMQIN